MLNSVLRQAVSLFLLSGNAWVDPVHGRTLKQAHSVNNFSQAPSDAPAISSPEVFSDSLKVSIAELIVPRGLYWVWS